MPLYHCILSKESKMNERSRERSCLDDGSHMDVYSNMYYKANPSGHSKKTDSKWLWTSQRTMEMDISCVFVCVNKWNGCVLLVRSGFLYISIHAFERSTQLSTKQYTLTHTQIPAICANACYEIDWWCIAYDMGEIVTFISTKQYHS